MQETPIMPDRLDTLFEMQDSLNRRIGVDVHNMTDEDRVKWVLNYCRAMSQETAELTDCVPWKWWAKYQKFETQNARVEIVDMLHFLVSLAQVMELTPDDIFEVYTRKHAVNLARQDSGYTKKDETDNQQI
jgi:dimeric dUTPase (all-alpha-NTP-PPase superfamily)